MSKDAEHSLGDNREVAVSIEPPDSADARECLASYFEDLRVRFGFQDRGSAADGEQIFLIARRNGKPIGCCALHIKGPRLGEIKRLWMHGEARGLGLGRRMLREVEALARSRGLTRLQLDTHASLVEAQSLYKSAGYVEVAPYNDNAFADHWFEKDLADPQSSSDR